MNSLEGTGESVSLSQYAKPCNACRKRKVRCDKKRPCQGCAKAKQLCTYDNYEERAPESQGDVHERLAKLEAMMANLMNNFYDQSTSTERLEIIPSATGNSQVVQATQANSVGHLYFQDGVSAYFDSDFWASLIPEIEDLRLLFEVVVPTPDLFNWLSSTSVLHTPSTYFSSTALASSHPTVEQSNQLCALFFACVNPFVRILHVGHFGKELAQWRRGTLAFMGEFEALLFSIYALTVNSVGINVVQRIFPRATKIEMVERFKQAAQMAMMRIEISRTDKIFALQALGHYLTLLFQQNYHSHATSILGLTFRQAQSIGLHRDPSHFPINPWVCAIRRRTFSHLYVLNALALSSYGTESCLPASADTLPTVNANDSDWLPSRFAKPGSLPQDREGFQEMTFCLVARQLAECTLQISHLPADDLKTKEALIDKTEAALYEKYLKFVDPTNQSHAIVAAFAEMKLGTLRLTIEQRRCRATEAEIEREERLKTYTHALLHLESLAYHIRTFTPLGWAWVFSTVVPWLATAIVLVELPGQEDQTRGRDAVNEVFARYQADMGLAESPMWRLLLRLKVQMLGEDVEQPVEMGDYEFADVGFGDVPWVNASMPLQPF